MKPAAQRALVFSRRLSGARHSLCLGRPWEWPDDNCSAFMATIEWVACHVPVVRRAAGPSSRSSRSSVQLARQYAFKRTPSSLLNCTCLHSVVLCSWLVRFERCAVFLLATCYYCLSLIGIAPQTTPRIIFIISSSCALTSRVSQFRLTNLHRDLSLLDWSRCETESTRSSVCIGRLFSVVVSCLFATSSRIGMKPENALQAHRRRRPIPRRMERFGRD
jgi:hypothetical protein